MRSDVSSSCFCVNAALDRRTSSIMPSPERSRLVRRLLAGDAERPAGALRVAVPVGGDGADLGVVENAAQIHKRFERELLGRQLGAVGQLEARLRTARRDDGGLAFVEWDLR